MKSSGVIFYGWSTWLWIAINAADGVWIYYFVKTSVDPVPHNAINRTHAGFKAYEALMFIFGFFLGCVNCFAAYVYYLWTEDERGRGRRSSERSFFFTFFNIFVMVPAWAFVIIVPFFGGWIVTALVQQHAWNHRCDSYPMYVILDGVSTRDPSFVKNRAYFYQQGRTETLFTYELSNPDDDDIWTFSLREFDSDQASIPLDLYPTLQYVKYDFVNYTFSGTCATPISPTDPDTTVRACLNGTYDNGNPLYLSMTSSIPLNDTSNVTPVPSDVVLRSQDNRWFFSDDPPSLVLREVENGALGETVLITAVSKVSDCTELKVCLAGTGAQRGSVVAAEVMAPLGLMLMRQGDYSLACTTSSGD